MKRAKESNTETPNMLAPDGQMTSIELSIGIKKTGFLPRREPAQEVRKKAWMICPEVARALRCSLVSVSRM
jgi:hypothetical protein